MKRNRIYVIIILSLIAQFGCNAPTKKAETKKFHYSLREIKKDFPHYKYHYDSISKEGYLEYYEANKLNEMLVFDSNEVIRYYVYYNTTLNEVRYSLEYNRDGKVLQESGRPIYLTSDFFGRKLGVKDSFGVFINVATPPYFNSSFVIYNIKEDLYDSINEYILQKNHTAFFVGSMNKEIQKKYAVITKITNPFDNEWVRIDTAYFSVYK